MKKQTFRIKTAIRPSDEINKITKNSIDSLKSYVNKQTWPQNFKKGIVRDEFLFDNNVIYLHYPMLFNEAFEVYDETLLKNLSIAGFFYFNAINLLDDFIDNTESIYFFETLEESNLLREHAIQLLTSIFPLDSKFWILWQQRRTEFAQAHLMNKDSKNKIKSISNYKAYANYKSAFAYSAIDALYTLSKLKNKDEVYKELIDTHFHFGTMLQVLDDLKDITDDLKQNQFNIINFDLNKKNKKGLNNDEIKSMLYDKGIISKYNHFGLKEGEKALKKILPLHLNYFRNVIQFIFNKIIIKDLNQEGFLSVFKTENRFALEPIPFKNITNENCIAMATQFILNKQKENGLWEDCFCNTGISDTWASAFLLSFLTKEIHSNKSDQLTKTIPLLKKQESFQKGWGYNTSWISDADSTTFVLLAFLNSKESIDLEVFNYWLTYQNSDGGFSKYNDINALQTVLFSPQIDVSGWMQSHLCVSSVAYYFLTKYDSKHPALKRLEEYIINSCTVESFYAYWWTDPIYIINYLLKGAKISGNKKIYTFCLSFLKTNYLNQKVLPKTILDNNFYLGLLLDILCKNPELKSKKQISYLYNLLLSRQKIDGSFESSYAMRTPAPNIINASENDIEYVKSNKGSNIIFKDYNRLLSTVVCLKAISLCTDFTIKHSSIELLFKESKLKKEAIVTVNKTEITSIPEISDSLYYLANEWESGYKKIKHIMDFSALNPVSKPHQEGDIFQRALTTTLLKTVVTNLGCIELNKIIEFEIDYLKSKKDSESGWRYFPNLIELPCDADSLAQIMQTFSEKSKEEFKQYFKEPLNKLIKSSKGGLFKTWIYSEKHIQVEKSNAERNWGVTHDVEVIANMGYAIQSNFDKLSFLNKREMLDVLKENALFIVNNQNIKGYWNAVWYEDIYYGTYVCLRFLIHFKEHIDVVTKALNFLIKTQNKDGSWGKPNQENTLSTAIVIMCLYETNYDNLYKEAILKASEFLISKKRKDGSYHSDNFIKMEIGRASGKVVNTIYYKSNIICTTYCVAALSYVFRK